LLAEVQFGTGAGFLQWKETFSMNTRRVCTGPWEREGVAPKDKPRKPRREAGTVTDRPIRLAGSLLDRRAHVCAFFSDPDEAYRVFLPFMMDGLELGDKNVHIVDPRLRDEHCQRISSAGVDLETVMQNGQFELRDWSNTHLRDGRFDQRKTLALLRQVMDDARKKGFPFTRFVTNMEWALDAGLDANALLEYESTTNYDWIKQDGPVNPVICSYDLNRFTADIVVDVIRTHPMVMIGGRLRENPFFVPPDEFLKELRRKKPAPLKKVG
jgi:hypothetical protein